MESLQLPQDLYWDIKPEPDSPSSEFLSTINAEDAWLFEDSFAKDILSPPNKIEPEFSNASSPCTEGVLLYEFEIDLKPEQWIDGKSNAHQILDYSESLLLPQSSPIQATKIQNPLEIFMDLEKFYDVTELTQLTPPQTPPQESSEVKEIFDLITGQQNSLCPSLTATNVTNNTNESNDAIIENVLPSIPSPSNSTDYSSDAVIESPLSPDLAREMQIVDEILRSRAKELPDFSDNDDYEDDDEESLHSSSSSSIISSSELSSPSITATNDDEWIQSADSSANNDDNSSSAPGKISHLKSQKKRTRPYGRGVEDKKIRKKEQNKNAATRYRQKKKQEMEEVLEEERELIKRNEELTKQYNDIEREVKYLKQLIREFHKSKNNNK